VGPTEVLPKEWQKHHDQLLNSIMRAAIGKDKHPSIWNIDVVLVKDYVTWYNLCIKVAAGKN